ncbi:nucleoside triphosphate pyrophosphohydrolase [Aureimonas endophytica]|uniref:Nucleoside triphosphate pyrophosphohydrolase n=1 Tax=Aureimonas endophytica TaxID=2027858 RepID=A0A916ZCR4_9HYPH|nr:nucleoside triphosphate pyrophosphohydrolase [Aureimonas endophytica]GGD89113.1 nucleoside triphosphate pyrophosphohydrolase [Aureimonas endophytica]
MQPSRDIRRLVEIMAALRDPQHGCPWDIEQSFDTIVPYTLEEAYEVADAIERRDADDLREELGDLLLQVVYYAQMAAERGFFDFEDVVEGITRKMVRRHPHVFGDEVARSARSAKGQWERIKAEERAEKALRQAELATRLDGRSGAAGEDWKQSARLDAAPLLLDSVPGNFPALVLALKVQQKAATVGFDWDAAEPIRAKIEEEFAEFDQAFAKDDREHMVDEFGDLLFSLVNLGRFHGLDPEMALRGCVAKFRYRFGHIERQLAAAGRTLTEASLAEMEALWVEAKTAPAAAQPAGDATRTSG